MDDEQYKELHSAIENADLDLVIQLLPDSSDGQYFSYEETSALFKAFSKERYEIASYLIRKGAKIHAFETYDVYRLDIDLTRLNYLLLDYNRKSEKSCIFKLISLSQSPQVLDGERLSAVISMYEEFFASETIRWLIKVLESEPFDIVYDFESPEVNRMHRLYNVEAEIYGLTLTNSREIFVGAKNLMSGDPWKKKKVYGVVVEELCHLAMTILFQNGAKPYKEEDSTLIQEFKVIVNNVKSSIDRLCHVESVIEDVFQYDYCEWECELIARVPHVVGIYGEEFGRRIFQESLELSQLLNFYERNVTPKCKDYTDPLLNTKSHRVMEGFLKRNEFISFKEKQICPLKEGFKSFREFLVVTEGISIIKTNCTKLCALHVYHEFKSEFGDKLEKNCLFFTRKIFMNESSKIIDALKCDVFKYFVLVLDETELTLRRLRTEYIDHFKIFEAGMLKIVMILNSQSLGGNFQEKAVCYKWNDLRDDFQALLQHIKYLYKGEEKDIYVRKEKFSKIFDEEEIMRIISGEVIKVEDGMGCKSRGYTPQTYIHREFQVMTIDEKYLQNIPPDTNIFISGLSREDLLELPIDGNMVQWLSSYRIEAEKSIFATGSRAITFEGFLTKFSELATQRKTIIHLCHKKKVFHLRNSSLSNIPIKHLKQMTITEGEMINLLENEKFAIISDNAGCGKSTTVSSLIEQVKGKDDSWTWRCNLGKFCTNQRDPLSLSHIEEGGDVEEILDHFFIMLGFHNGLEKLLFRTPSERGNCYLFFDAYDEVPTKFRSKVSNLLSTLKEVRGVSLIVTTRKCHQQELEQLLCTDAHQLVPFTREAQVGYLAKLWKNKLKFPNEQSSLRDKKIVPAKIEKIIKELKKEKKLGPEHEELLALEKVQLENSLDLLRNEIDKLDFSKIAEHILDKTLLDYGTFQFMGFPLHLYMIGTISYKANFKPALHSDIFDLYSQFVEQKILEYVDEKLGLREGSFKDSTLEEIQRDAYRIHIQLAEQLIDHEKVYLASEMNSKDGKLVSDLGIAFIEGESIQFIHHTFAEFFKAKSVEQNMQEDVFKKVLLEDKYDTVVAFLSTCLWKKNFENLGKDFFEGTSFLVVFMKRIIHKRPFFSRYFTNLDVLCRFRITKMLLESFEKKFELKEFKDGLGQMLLNPKCYDSDEMEFHCIGGCLTVDLIKFLLGNLQVDSVILLSFVRYSDNHHEVMKVLEEFISLESDGETGIQLCDSEIRSNANGNAERLSELRLLKDSSGDSLLYHALCNDRAEIFAHLLKFFEDNSSEEKFMEEVVQSDDYKHHVDEFINSVHFRRTWMFLKELHSVFGNKVAHLFDKNSTSKIICNAVKTDLSDGSTKYFGKVTSLFKDYFGIQEWNGFLCACFVSKDLLNILHNCSSGSMMKYLNILKSVFDENGKMKQILECKIGDSYNFLHLAAFKSDVCFDDMLQFFADYLEEEDIKKMLLCPDKDGHNVMHYFFTSDFYHSNNSIRNLNVIMEKYGKDEHFRELLKKMGKDFNDIFQLSVLRGNNLEHLLKFCSTHFEKDDIKEVIFNAYHNNFMQCLFWKHSYETIRMNLTQIKEFLNDDESFRELLKRKWPSRNIFQLAGLRNMCLKDLLEFCYDNLEVLDIQEMICSPDADGHNLIHYFFTHNDPRTLMSNLNLLRRVLGDECFKQLLNSEKSLFKNLYHITGIRNPYLNEILLDT